MMYDEVRLHGGDETGGLSRMKVAKSGRVATIEFAHLAVHEDGFAVATHVTTAASTAERVYHIKPPASYDLHSVFEVQATAGASFELYECPSSDVTSDGTVLTHVRPNRGSTVGSTARYTSYHTPTLSTGAALTKLMSKHNGGTATAQGNVVNVGGGARPGEEFIFPSSAGKSWLVYAKPEASARVSFVHEYYEV